MRVTTLASVLIAVAAVATQEEIATQALLAAFGIAVGSWFSYVRRRVRSWWVKGIITFLVLAATQAFFRGLLDNPYDPRLPLIQLFLWLQVLHSFDLPARKDLKYSLASAVVVMAVGAVYARDLTFGAFLVPFAIVGCIAVVCMRPATFRLTPKTAVVIGALLSVIVLLVGTVIFASIPREQGLRARWLPISARFLRPFEVPERIINPAYPEVPGRDPEQAPLPFNPYGYVGFSTYVDLRLRGILTDDLVMRVRATRSGFWRGLAFDEYTGKGWRMRDRAVDENVGEGPRIIPRFGVDEPWPANSDQVIQTFYIEAPQPNVIFAAYRPFEVYFPTGNLGVDRYAGLRSPAALEKGMVYSVISRVPNPPPPLLARHDNSYPERIRDRYLHLPGVPLRVRQLATHLTDGLSTPYAKAVAINRYLLQGYQYNLQAPVLPEGADAVDYFLFTSRQGACETFASAMAVLLRAAGVPARLVTGYVSGEYNLVTGYYEVRNSDAHAWVEAYLPRVGWIEFEASPGFDAPDVLTNSPVDRWLARDAVVWMVRVLGPAARSVEAAFVTFAGMGTGGGINALWAFLVVALAVLLVRQHTSRRNGSWRAGVGGLYARMAAALAREGITRQVNVTPREFAMRMPAPIRTPVEAITSLFEEYRYGLAMIPLAREAEGRAALTELHALLRDRSHRNGG